MYIKNHLLLGIIILLASCGGESSNGRPFNMSAADRLIPGVTTEEEAIAMIGQPVSIDQNAKNDHELLTWRYLHVDVGTFGKTATQSSYLSVSFDGQKKMLKVIHQANE